MEQKGGSIMKACPFCKSVELGRYQNPADNKEHVFCRECEAEGPAGDTIEEAEKLWGERVK